MAKVDIWMPLFIGDYLADTMRLSTEQHGAYLLLLMELWMAGPLADDDEELAGICRLPLDRWLRMRPKIARFFHITDGNWTHKRVDIEKERAEKRRQAAAENGRKGGRPRKEEKPSKNPRVNPAETYGLSKQEPGGEPSSKAKPNPAKSSSPSQYKTPVPEVGSSTEVSAAREGDEKIWGAGS